MNKITEFLIAVTFVVVIFLVAIDIDNKLTAKNVALEIISRLATIDDHLNIVGKGILMVYVKQEKL